MNQEWSRLLATKPSTSQNGSPREAQHTGRIKELMARYTQPTSDRKSERNESEQARTIFGSSERPRTGCLKPNSMGNSVSEHPKLASNIMGQIKTSGSTQRDPKTDPNHKLQLKSAFQTTRDSKRSVKFEDIEASAPARDGPLSFGSLGMTEKPSQRQTLPINLTAKPERLTSSHDFGGAWRLEKEADAAAHSTATIAIPSIKIMNSNIDPSIGTRVIVGGDKAVKVFAPAIRSSHTASENRSVRVSEDNGFDKRRITNKHKGHTGYREKQALEELKDSEVLMQNAMDRLYTSGRIRTIAATVNDKSAATELMNRHNFYGKLLTFDILDMTVVKGMNLAKLEVREVGGHYRKEPSVSKGDRLFGLFKHGSDISGLCQLLDTRVLKVIDPTIVQCQRSRNFYCLIKYFRVDRL